jgi:hypothetical protein
LSEFVKGEYWIEEGEWHFVNWKAKLRKVGDAFEHFIKAQFRRAFPTFWKGVFELTKGGEGEGPWGPMSFSLLLAPSISTRYSLPSPLFWPNGRQAMGLLNGRTEENCPLGGMGRGLLAETTNVPHNELKLEPTKMRKGEKGFEERHRCIEGEGGMKRPMGKMISRKEKRDYDKELLWWDSGMSRQNTIMGENAMECASRCLYFPSHQLEYSLLSQNSGNA